MNPFKISILATLSAFSFSSCNDNAANSSAALEEKSSLPQGPEAAPEGMVWIPGGTYWRGNE
jgi:hypothetical protein